MNGERQKPLDVISFIATVVPPIWFVFRLVTGGWSFITFFLVISAGVTAFYWQFILRADPYTDDDFESDGDSPASRSQPIKTSPAIMAAIAGAYVLVLLISAFCGFLATK